MLGTQSSSDWLWVRDTRAQALTRVVRAQTRARAHARAATVGWEVGKGWWGGRVGGR